MLARDGILSRMAQQPLRSPYAPKQARAEPAVGKDFAAGDDAGPLPPVRVPGGLREHTERPAVYVYSFPIFGLMTRFIRTLGDTSSEPPRAVTRS